jgi:tyrosine aminotransferase
MVFGDAAFHPLASLSTTVPVLELGGMAKHFLVPGWRVGWLIVHDRGGVLERARHGFAMLAQLRFAPNSLALSVVPDALTPEPDSAEAKALAEFKADYYSTLERNAQVTVDNLAKTPGLDVVKPQGTMYAMVSTILLLMTLIQSLSVTDWRAMSLPADQDRPERVQRH